jgi:hypothetical protein
MAWHCLCVPSPTKYVSTSDHHQGMPLGFCEDLPHVLARRGCWHRFSCTRRLLLANQVCGISNHALKLISTPKIPSSEDVSIAGLGCEQGIMYAFVDGLGIV